VNKEQIIKLVWNRAVRLRPVPKFFDAPYGNEIGPIDQPWLIHQVTKENGVHIEMEVGGYAFKLNWDSIRECRSDPGRGNRHGFLRSRFSFASAATRFGLSPSFLREIDATP
jgi:hypothetical protein